MQKLKNESALFKEALIAGVKYAEGRGAVVFEPTDSASEKLLYIYRLLVHDKVIQPLPEDQVAEKSLRHKLSLWYVKQLPKDHPLLKQMTVESIPKFTLPALKLWDAIPIDSKQSLLSNVWCGKCRHEVTITNFSGTVTKGDLLLVGKRSECHGDVAKVIERR